MIKYGGLAQAFLGARTAPIESDVGKSLLSFARELGLFGPVAEALFALPRPDEDIDESAYAHELSEAFRFIEGNDAEKAQAFRRFAFSLSEGWPKKTAAERFGERLLAARDFEGALLIQSELARAHIQANLRMLNEIGEHHLYEPWKWNEYIEAAYHDLSTFDYIMNTVVLAMMGSSATPVQQLAKNLNRMAGKCLGDEPPKPDCLISKRCLAMGNALRRGPSAALLNLLLDIWTLTVKENTDVFGKFEREKPRSGFFSKISPPQEGEATLVDLHSIARRTIPDFGGLETPANNVCSNLFEGAALMGQGVSSEGIALNSTMPMEGLTPCVPLFALTCSGTATFPI